MRTTLKTMPSETGEAGNSGRLVTAEPERRLSSGLADNARGDHSATPRSNDGSGNLAGAIEAAADLADAADRFEQLRAKLDCEAFAMRERMEARSAEYFRRKDLEKA